MQYVPTKAARVSLICHHDPALDREKCDLKAYSATLDESHLTFQDGREPTRYLFSAPGRWEEEWLAGEIIGQDNAAMVGRSWVQACLCEVTGPHAVSEQTVREARQLHKGLRLLPLSAPFLSDRKTFPPAAYWFLGMLLPIHMQMSGDEGN